MLLPVEPEVVPLLVPEGSVVPGVLGLSVSGLSVPGLSVPGLSVPGLSVPGLSGVGFSDQSVTLQSCVPQNGLAIPRKSPLSVGINARPPWL